MWKESTRDESFNFFKFISHTINTWEQRVPQDMSNSISTCILKNLLHESKPMNYESMVYVYGWIMEEHQPIGLIINLSEMMITLKIWWRNTTWNLMKIVETNQDFGITLFLKQNLINSIRSMRQSLTRRGERNSSKRKIWWWYILGKKESQLK